MKRSKSPGAFPLTKPLNSSTAFLTPSNAISTKKNRRTTPPNLKNPRTQRHLKVLHPLKILSRSSAFCDKLPSRGSHPNAIHFRRAGHRRSLVWRPATTARGAGARTAPARIGLENLSPCAHVERHGGVDGISVGGRRSA